jgi:hypothetical protein
MPDDGIQLRLKGSIFKVDFLPILAGILEAGAKTLLTLKTGGASLALAPNLITGLFGALKGIKLEESAELKAWLLVSGGLFYAIEKSIASTSFNKDPPPTAFKQLLNDIGIRVQTRTYKIEPDFFSSPTELELLDDVAHELSAWGAQFGGSDKPKDAKERIIKYFPEGLHRTWMKNTRRFESLEHSLNSPFVPAMKTQREFDGYLQYIEEQFTELRLIGQDEEDPHAVKLAQVFVPLRAYVEERGSTKTKRVKTRNEEAQSIELIDPAESNADSECKRKIVQFFEALDIWVSAADRKDPLRIVSGGPGIGKSSSMRGYAARIARSELAFPILVPLQKLGKPEQPLRDRIRDYLISTKDIPFTMSPLDTVNGSPHGRPFVLIFDGLDELVRPGKDADDIAREFMVDLRGLLDQENGLQGVSPARMVAVITGRVAAASSAARALKCSGKQVLFLLRFYELQQSRELRLVTKPVEVDDPNNLLEEDQRKTWWSLWYIAAAKVPKQIPNVFLHEDLHEVTIEPLLLYFVALIRPWEIKPEKGDIVRNWLYDRLLRHFYDRECSKGDLNFATEFQTFEDYEVVLQAMAMAAWYDGSTRVGTIETVEKLLRDWDSSIADSFKHVIGSNKPAISAALAFYMRPGESPNSFEFLHKTFAEYLVARRIVEAVRGISELFKDSASGRGGRRRSFGPMEHLEDWLRLAGPRSIDFDLLRFLRDEVSHLYKNEASVVKDWREALAACLRANLRDGMPAHLLFQLPDDRLVRRPQTFRDASDQARNAEETLLAALNATILPSLMDVNFKPIDIRPPSIDGALLGNMIHRLRGQRVDGSALSLRLFSGLAINNERLFIQDLFNLEAIRSDFSRSLLYCANIESANLTDANFSNAQLERVSFFRSRLVRAEFDGADMEEVNLEDADLSGAKHAKATRRADRLIRR